MDETRGDLENCDQLLIGLLKNVDDRKMASELKTQYNIMIYSLHENIDSSEEVSRKFNFLTIKETLKNPICTCTRI